MNRTTIKKGLAPAALVLTAALALSACGSDGDSAEAGGGVSGSVRVDGSSTVAPLASFAAEKFQEANSGARVTVGTSGTGGGFEKFCKSETDVNNASRPVKDEETKLCTDNGIETSELQVAVDAVTIVVNKDNDFASCLTTDQLKKIWEPGSKVSNWNQVDPSFPDLGIKLYGPGTDSGTFDYFTDEINGEEGASRTDYNPSEDDNIIVQGVEGDKGSLGYFGFTYYEENADKLNVVQVDSGDGCVTPSVESAQDGSYTPLSRPLYVYASHNAVQENPTAKAFLDYFVTNDAEIADEAGFIPLNEDQKAKLVADWAKAQK